MRPDRYNCRHDYEQEVIDRDKLAQWHRTMFAMMSVRIFEEMGND